MCKFKEGDKAIVLKNTSGHGFSIGAEVEVVGESGIYNGEKEYECKTISEYWFLTTSELKKKENLEYKTSNRHKLQQAIKETGYSSRRLSDIAVGNESYFYNYTGKARFDKKGDIKEDRLNSLLTTLAFAERELLGISAKTVDDQVKPKDFGNRVENKFLNDEEIKLMDSSEYKNIADDFKSGMQESVVDSYIDPVETTQPKSSNFTKVGIIAIVILLLILIVKNLVV